MRRTTGTIISAKKQWWLKINKKPIRKGPLDGAVFPYIIKVRYMVDGKEYIKRKWIGTEYPVPVEVLKAIQFSFLMKKTIQKK